MTVLFHTLGCKLNFAESASMAETFSAEGIRTVNEGETPDLIVVNTCTVTGEADKKCRQIIRSFSRRYPQAKIIVTGCYAQLASHEIMELPGVILVAGNDRKEKIITYLKSLSRPQAMITPGNEMHDFQPICSHGDRTRYFLKVQDGCNYFCTYCAIPLARGRSRSASVAQTIDVARRAIAQGAKEIVLTGVNTGEFGKQHGETFLELIQELDKLEKIERYRISSIEPNLLTDEIIDFVKNSRHFMPHFHVPLQSGDDEILKLMHRRYDTAFFREKMLEIRRKMPDAFIGVDVIVGMRGETEERFENALTFIDSLPISRLHVFTYSERPGTRALDIPHVVSQEEKHHRTHRMMQLSDKKLHEFASGFIGSTRPVLAEHCQAGFTDNYLRVNLPESIVPNTIVNVTLGDCNSEGTFEIKQ